MTPSPTTPLDRPALRRTGLAPGAPLRLPELAKLSALFWACVTLSAIVYAGGLSATLATFSDRTLFAPWYTRLLQHLFLLPVLIACYAVSLRLGWRPTLTRVPLQIALALAFALLANPAMWLATECVEFATGHAWTTHGRAVHGKRAPMFSLWSATAADFLIKYGFGAALLTLFGNYKSLRDAQLRNAALEQQISAARLAALRMQLSPHTLFNLLNLIRAQIAWDPPAAQALVVKLADLLRRLLNAGERELVPLREEYRFASAYLELQRERFTERLSLQLPDEKSLPDVWVPSLILQPLIENAVVHGLRDHDAPVRIGLEAQVEHEVLVLRVTNTTAPNAQARASAEHAPGAGEPPARAMPSRALGAEVDHSGLGLRNVRARLEVQFGSAASLRSGPDGPASWLSELRLPVLRSDAPASAASPATAPAPPFVAPGNSVGAIGAARAPAAVSSSAASVT